MKSITKQLMLLLCLCLGAVMANAQQKQITGTVIDNVGEPLANVAVTVKGTTTGTTTKEDGSFTLTVSGSNPVLVVSALNYAKQEVPVGSQTTVSIVLEPVTSDLSEVVVTALGIKREKKSLGYAVQEIKGDALADTKEPNLANSLTGKVAGLQVVRSSNGPAGSSKIVLRGYNSLTGNNQPLIVVDGTPIANFTGAGNNDYWNPSLDMGNGLSDINAEDIASVSILKGPSAAALYGSRAGNGVILITTKTGRKNNGLGLTISSTLGIESIFVKPELQNTFAQGDNGLYDSKKNGSWGPKAEGQQVTNWNGETVPLRIYDNVDNYFNKGIRSEQNVSFQQQFNNTSVYTSFNRLDDKSMIPGAKLQRTSLMTRAVTKFGKDDRWSLDTKLQYTNNNAKNRPIQGNNYSNSFFTLFMLPRSLDIREFNPPVNEAGKMIWYNGANQYNPYWMSEYNLNNDIRDRFIMTANLRYEFTDWLNAELRAGGDLYTTSTEAKTYAGSPITSTGRYSIGKETFNETNYSAMITARKDDVFGKFGGVLMVGGNLMNQKWSSINSSSGDLVVPNLFSLNNGVNNPTVGEGYTHQMINSLYGNAQINYDGYLFLDATFRNDWSSTLSKANRSFFYPSLSLSYVFTDMATRIGMNTPAWLSYAKLRASYASVGNGLQPYELYNTYGIGKDPNGNTTAYRNRILFDPNVRSELIKSYEVGAEMRFAQNRIGFDLSFYKSNATNQLINLPMDPLSGYSFRKINAGNIQNKGVELVVDGRVLNNPSGLNWNVQLNYSANRNKIVELTDDVTTYGLGGFDALQIIAVTGQNYGEIYGTTFVRVEDKTSPYYGKMILSSSGLPQYNSDPKRLGNQSALGLFGMTNSFSYKGVGLSFLFDARIGGQIFSGTNSELQQVGNAAVTAPGGQRNDIVVDGVIKDSEGKLTPNTVSISQQQYWSAVADQGNLGIIEANIYDATNVRLRNIMLSYDVPKNFLSKTPFQSARLGVSCNNVWLISSHLNGVDPESVYATNTNAVGFENASPPTTRVFLFNLSLGF